MINLLIRLFIVTSLMLSPGQSEWFYYETTQPLTYSPTISACGAIVTQHHPVLDNGHGQAQGTFKIIATSPNISITVSTELGTKQWSQGSTCGHFMYLPLVVLLREPTVKPRYVVSLPVLLVHQ